MGSGELGASGMVAGERSAAGRGAWLFSWPLLVGVSIFLYSLHEAKHILLDGDTYWHIAAGHWIWSNGAIPTTDPFSYTKQGAPWMAHEWLSEIMLAAAHHVGGWLGLVTLTAFAFASTIALMTRALLRRLEPIYALLFAGFAVSMTIGHLLARPHMLAMPLMMVWTIELVRASDANRSPRLWLLPLMTLWANLHGGFTLGLALACAFALEAVVTTARNERMAAGQRWGIFLALAVISALLTPHGPKGILFTWQMMTEHSFALEHVGEWRSSNFQVFQPLEVWLLGGLALVLHQGLRLPPIRLLLLIGLLHLALKHVRNIELVGLLAPLFLASPLADQWGQKRRTDQQFEIADRFFARLAQPAGMGAILLSLVIALAAPYWHTRVRPFEPPESITPARALAAVEKAGVKGPVLNSYSTGGYLIYLGIPAFIDGRNDVYGDDFLKEYVEAIGLNKSGGLQKLLDQYRVTWTLLEPDMPAVALLDHLPGWKRLYTDKSAVVHVKTSPGDAATSNERPGPEYSQTSGSKP